MWKMFAFAGFTAIPPSLGQEEETRRPATGRGTQPPLRVAPQPDWMGVYTVGESVSAPALMYSEPAVYNERMLDIDAPGTVLVTTVVGSDGIPAGTDVVIPFMRPFDYAAVLAVNRLRFEPAIFNGIPVPVRIFVELSFSMNKSPALPRILQPGLPLEPPEVLFALRPKYPSSARKRRIRGTVVVSFVVTREGLPADLQLIHPVARSLDESAMRAVRSFRFRPATLRGEPVPSHITIDVTYRLYF
jgi:TonB family protein